MFKVKKRGGPAGDVKTVGVPSCYENVNSGTTTSDAAKRDAGFSNISTVPGSATSSGIYISW